jgi:hypothetical protein
MKSLDLALEKIVKHIHNVGICHFVRAQFSTRLLDQCLCFLTETAPSSLQTVAQLFAGGVPALQVAVVIGVAARGRVVAEGNADAALVLGWTAATV